MSIFTSIPKAFFRFYLKKVLLSVLYMLLVQQLYGVELKFRHFKQDNGLSSNTIHCLYQDSRGYIWIGTSDGLNRFDSKNFKVFKYEQGNNKSIGNNTIYSIYEDKNHSLWVGTQHGVYVFDARTETFESIQLVNSNVSGGNQLVYSIAEYKDRYIMIATLGNGLFRYDKETKEVTHYSKESNSGLFSDYVSKVFVDDDDNIWIIAGGNVIHRLLATSNQIEQIPIHSNGVDLNNAFDLCEDTYGNLWITGVSCGIFKFNKKTFEVENFLVSDGQPIIEKRIHSIVEWEPGVLMMGTDEGLLVFDIESNAVSRATSNKGNSFGLSDHFVYPILKDNDGGLWVGTYWGGVNFSSKNNHYFDLFSYNSKRNHVSGRVIGKFAEDSEGNIWIGTDDSGLHYYNSDTRKIQKVVIDEDNPNLNIHALYSDKDILWIGTYGLGLYRYNLRTKEVKHYYNRTAPGLDDSSIYSIYKDSSGKIWIGTKRSINIFNPDTGVFTSVIELNHNCDVLDIIEGEDGVIWFASIGQGVISYHHKTMNIKYYSTDDKNAENIPNQCRALIMHGSKIWVGTIGRGLWYYDQAKDKFIKEESNELFNEHSTIYNILEDNNTLWITTNVGLLNYNPSIKKAAIFNFEDGLQGNLFNPNSGIKSSRGEVFLGGNNGFNVFNPRILPESLKEIAVVLLDFKLFNQSIHFDDQSILKEHIDFQKKVSLKYNDRNFSLEFTALNFNSPSRIKYRYYLEGFDTDWVYVNSDNRVATYTNIPIGKYKFKVMASENEEWYPQNTTTVDLEILPPWWATTAARMLYVLLILIALYRLYWYYVKKAVNRQKIKLDRINLEKEKQLTNEKFQFFMNIAHEIRTPATLISAPLYDILRYRDVPDEIREDLHIVKKNSDRLVSLINQILDFSKIEQQLFQEHSEIEIIKMIQATIERSAPLVKAKNITVRTIFCSNEVYAKIDQDTFEKIFSNLFINAIKFTKDEVEVKLEYKDGLNFLLSVSDNGAGIEKENLDNIFNLFYQTPQKVTNDHTGFGIGLAIVNQLSKKIGANIYVDSILNVKTTFHVEFPFSKSALKEKVDKEEVAGVNIDRDLKPIELNPILSKSSQIKASILIVDDNVELLAYFSKFQHGEFQIITVSSGSEALDLLTTKQIDLVVSDVAMPQMNGFELCAAIKQNSDTNHIPVILLSAHTDIDSKIKGLENGADVYIEKPVVMDYLFAQVVSLLEKQESARLLFSKKPFVPINSIYENKADREFLTKLQQFVEDNMTSSSLSIADVASYMNVSRTVLYNKTKTITGETPNDFVRLVRLKKAAEYLSAGDYKISEICYLVGFNSPSYFTKCFQAQFGVLPKNFIK